MRPPARFSQCERILHVLQDGEPHSAAEIHRISGFSRLNSRISELRKRGYDIACVRDVGKSGPEAYVYTLSRSIASSPSPASTPSEAGQLLMFDPWSRRVA